MTATALNVAVLFGGSSAEREVSLRGGAAVAAALRGLGHRVWEVDPRSRRVALPPTTDVAFLALHGEFGEDGVVQSQLESLGVPYTGCGVEASRVAFDKILTKRRCLERGLPTARHFVVCDSGAPLPADWQPPFVLKPARQGSSVGLRFVDHADQWRAALAAALRHGSEVLVEEKIVGRETTVALLDGQALPVVEIRPHDGVYDYQNKYTGSRTEYLCPAPFDEPATERIQAVAGQAFAAIGGRDYGRVDIIVRADGTPVVLEVNTLPGMTETSLFPKAAAAAGIAFPQLCQRMIDLALRRSSALAH